MSEFVVVMPASPSRGMTFEIPKSRTFSTLVPFDFFASQKEVARLEVAMNDAGRVRLGEPFARLEDVGDRLFDLELSPADKEGAEILPLEVLHHHVRRPVRERGDVGHTNDVIALDPRRGARLADEACDGAARILLVVDAEYLDREAMAHGDVARRQDDAHPPRADLPFDAVFPRDHVARLDGELGLGGLGHRAVLGSSHVTRESPSRTLGSGATGCAVTAVGAPGAGGAVAEGGTRRPTSSIAAFPNASTTAKESPPAPSPPGPPLAPIPPWPPAVPPAPALDVVVQPNTPVPPQDRARRGVRAPAAPCAAAPAPGAPPAPPPGPPLPFRRRPP